MLCAEFSLCMTGAAETGCHGLSRSRPTRTGIMPAKCSHIDTIREVTPNARGCEECLKMGSSWVHLRLCRTCGHVGCCDDSPNRHATRHFHATGHPIIEGYDPPEGWGCCQHRSDFAVKLSV